MIEALFSAFKVVTGGTQAAGVYNVTGMGTKAYSISDPGSVIISSAGNNMTVNTFTHDAGPTPALTGGTDTFNVTITKIYENDNYLCIYIII